MSILIVGLSHHSAPVSVLERVALTGEEAAKLAVVVGEEEHVTESAVLATCNRVEIYADVERFHGPVETLSGLLADRAGIRVEDLLPHLYVHYDDGAVSHLFHVASGLDSMVVGEGQILGQTREALRRGQEVGTVGPALNSLFQQALRVAKRGHTETGIDQAAPSLVGASLDRAEAWVGALEGRRLVVIGAGAMASLAVATAARRGADVVVANRTPQRAARLADGYGADAVALTDLAEVVRDAEVLVSCTGATGVVLPAEVVAASHRRPLAVIDLALPHDVDPAVADLDGVRLIGLASLADEIHSEGADGSIEAAEPHDVAAVRRIVAEEVAAFLSARRAAAVTPTVVALRTMATGVVDAELGRLAARLPDLDEETLREVRHTVRRVADKLMHAPTVRIKELANDSTVSYAAALAELFALDPEAVEAVTRPEGGGR